MAFIDLITIWIYFLNWNILIYNILQFLIGHSNFISFYYKLKKKIFFWYIKVLLINKSLGYTDSTEKIWKQHQQKKLKKGKLIKKKLGKLEPMNGKSATCIYFKLDGLIKL